MACRAVVYGALVPLSRFRPANGPEEKRDNLARANAAKFVRRLCRYPSDSKPEEKADIERAVAEARRHILEAHAERLTRETAKTVTVEDIVEGRASRPKVLDMFAGGGSIPLEALRLGCEAYALDLNPVAHIIELCTLVYPQKYGKPDPAARGMTGPKNAKGEPTWGGLAEEVRYWGNWVLEKVRAEIGDLYPLIPDPEDKPEEIGEQPQSIMEFAKGRQERLKVPAGYLTPVAYLWTRTVRCKRPSCGATVPLVRQTWLCRKSVKKRPGLYVALKVVAPKGDKKVRFEVVEAATEEGLGFDPSAGSKGGNATCPFCGTVADIDYVKAEGRAGRMSEQMMAVVCIRPGQKGKVYIAADKLPDHYVPDDGAIRRQVDELCQKIGLTVPDEPIANLPDDCYENTLGITVRPYGIRRFGDLFTPRQMLCHLAFAGAIREACRMIHCPEDEPGRERIAAVATSCACLIDKIATRNNRSAGWDSGYEKIMQIFGRQTITMVWDFPESNPLALAGSGNFQEAVRGTTDALDSGAMIERYAIVLRGSATSQLWPGETFDAVITDPPYYDNVPYADISDFFYVWLKRTIGDLYLEHFASAGTPKKNEAVADATRCSGSKVKARRKYEEMMARSFAEAHRVLKPGAQMVVVYAHKTTLGWSTLVDALRSAGFTVSEAWPLDTEGQRLRAVNSAALASSIFLVARKREESENGSYEYEVRPELERIVRERVDTLWKMGITGADLVIAAVGAGLRAFTRFARVECANGEELPAEKFLAEVEGVVLETLLEKIFGLARSSVAAVDGPSRFYVLWRYTYRAAEMDAGEAIVFTYGQNVELDGRNGLSTGSRALIEKKKGKYRLYDFTERGHNEKLGLPTEDGRPAPLIDALHRILWLIENEPRNLNRFLDEARPDREHLRLLAQVLAGTTLEHAGVREIAGDTHVYTTQREHRALTSRLLANWRALVDRRLAASQGTLFDSMR